jgi:hypothetical protein
MDEDRTSVGGRASETALAFGLLIRSRRKALHMRQAGKPSCQLGRSLLVADALGLRVTDLLASGSSSLNAPTPGQELPDLPEEVDELDGQSTRIL